MDFTELLQRVADDLLARPSGPLAIRFLIQPAMSTIFAIRDGIKDAREGRSPYFWTVLTDPVERGARLREGLSATAKIMILAIVLDAVYQFRVLGTFYPGEAIVIALVLAFIPYLLIRGPVARIARRWNSARSANRGKV
jgi:hypothetical protein